MENSPQEIKLLQSCINDLMSVLALPPIWSGGDSSQVVITLLDALVGMLRLDFAFARFLENSSEIDILRLAKGQTTNVLPRDVGLKLKDRPTNASLTSPALIPNPIGEGEVFVASLRLGLHDEIGFLVAASKRRDFPTRIETLLLRVAANQAVVGLQKAQLLGARKQAAEEVEQKIAERTRQVTAINAELLREISVRERTEEALRTSEERFRRYFELGLIGMAITSPDKGCLEVNDELCRLLGYDRGELLQKPWSELTHPEDLAADLTQFERVLAGEINGYTLDKRWIRKDGQVIDSIMSAQCVRHPDGSVDFFVGLVLDTTERILAEEKLRRSEANLADGQRLSHTGSWAWNVATGECFWSLEHFRLFGLDPENFDPTLENTQRFIHREDLPFVEQTLQRAIRDRTDFEVDYRLVRPDGSIRYHHGVGHPVVRESGELEFVGSVMDVTGRKQAEEELRKTQQELAHVTRVTTVGELTASIAHEVNQPLGAIVTNGHACLRLLSRDDPDLDEARAAVECMIEEGMRASEVIKRIRALVKKSGSGKSSHNINDTIREVIAFAAGELKKNQVNLHTELADDLPLVIADRVQLQQVMLNLILNSNEAMSGFGWQPRELLIRAEQVGPREIMVTVKDTGPGLDPENRERAFEPFFTSKEGGLGLGLSISKTIIEAHGGKLQNVPSGDTGATFQFSLPVAGESS